MGDYDWIGNNLWCIRFGTVPSRRLVDRHPLIRDMPSARRDGFDTYI